MRRLTVTFALVLAACGGERRPSHGGELIGAARPFIPASGVSTDSGDGGESYPYEPPRVVQASPGAQSEFALPSGTQVIALAPSTLRPEVALLLRDSAGVDRIVLWQAGGTALLPIAALPAGTRGTSIAVHPQWGSVYVATRGDSSSGIRGYFPDSGKWVERALYSTDRKVADLVFGPRPYESEHGKRYRLYFSALSADGTTATRTITESGRLEYQVIGPSQPPGQYQNSYGDVPTFLTAPFGVPMGLHPNGTALLWHDRRGCTHRLEYDFAVWGEDRAVPGIECGGTVQFSPNARAYLVWRGGSAGVTLVPLDGGPRAVQGREVTFAASPASVPDGRGVIGPVVRPDGGVALVYLPISLPLADVTNLWALSANRCEDSLLARHSGFFSREGEHSYAEFDQLYSVYERSNYDEAGGLPLLVTTDLFWENFAAAFNGVFILEERHRAIPAFWAFIDAAAQHYEEKGQGNEAASRWAKVFNTLGNFHAGTRVDEEGLIATETGSAPSSALDTIFNYGELKPRGHYTSDSTMSEYFRAMRYLTEAARLRDPSELAQLPPAVQRKALAWISVYLPYIAPPRPPEWVWTEGSTPPMATYAKAPRKFRGIFPMGWGVDNEVLEASAYNLERPADELVAGPAGQRQLPSGLDVATMFGSPLAAVLLADTLKAYPPLAGVLAGIRARRPVIEAGASVYQRWMDAIAVEWADSSSIPGSADRSPAWSVKRLQTGLASWAILREATVLVTERPIAAEAGEGGFEPLVPERPRGYVEPAPRTFEVIASLYDALATSLERGGGFAVGAARPSEWEATDLRDGVVKRLRASAAEARTFAEMATREVRGEPLREEEYEAIQRIGGAIEHQFLLYKSLAEPTLAISTPDRVARIADVAGNPDRGYLEVAAGDPLEWRQLVPFFGRRQVALGSVYSYYEFTSRKLYDNEQWRREVARTPRPEWVRPYMAPARASCRTDGR